MAVFHGVGLLFEWSDRTGMLASFKVCDNDRLGYTPDGSDEVERGIIDPKSVKPTSPAFSITAPLLLPKRF
jgi:hypothetical protein